MAVFGGIAIYIFVHASSLNDPSPFLVVVVVMILQIIAILGLTFILLKVWEQHTIPEYVHKNAKMFFDESKKIKNKNEGSKK
ncbi:MAG: hypothetical protein ACMXX7_02245 [Candidatus Woesearchaeota archaeon]